LTDPSVNSSLGAEMLDDGDRSNSILQVKATGTPSASVVVPAAVTTRNEPEITLRNVTVLEDDMATGRAGSAAAKSARVRPTGASKTTSIGSVGSAPLSCPERNHQPLSLAMRGVSCRLTPIPVPREGRAKRERKREGAAGGYTIGAPLDLVDERRRQRNQHPPSPMATYRPPEK